MSPRGHNMIPSNTWSSQWRHDRKWFQGVQHDCLSDLLASIWAPMLHLWDSKANMPFHHPNMLLERSIFNLLILHILYLQCEKCHHPFQTWNLTMLYSSFQVENTMEWLEVMCACISHKKWIYIFIKCVLVPSGFWVSWKITNHKGEAEACTSHILSFVYHPHAITKTWYASYAFLFPLYRMKTEHINIGCTYHLKEHL